EAAARNRLGAPRDPLAALEDLAHQPVGLELLQEVVDRQRRVGVVQPGDEPDRHPVLAHRVDPGTAVLVVPGAELDWPDQRVDDAAERPGDLPDLLDAELVRLGGGVELVLAAKHAGEVAGRALREHGDLRSELDAGLEGGKLLALASAALVPSDH